MYKKRYLFVPIFVTFITAVIVSRNMLVQSVQATESYKSLSEQLAAHDYEEYLKILEQIRKEVNTLSPLDPDIVYGPDGEIAFIKGTPPPENTGGTFFSNLGFIPLTPKPAQAKAPAQATTVAVSASPQPQPQPTQQVLASTTTTTPTQISQPVQEQAPARVVQPIVVTKPKANTVVNTQAVGGTATPVVASAPTSAPTPAKIEKPQEEKKEEKKEEKREEKQEKEHGKKSS